MSDAVEQRVRDAGDRAVPPFDAAAVRERARARRRARRARRFAAVAVTIGLVAAVAVTLAGRGDTTHRIDATRPLPTFSRTPGIPGAYQVGSIATDGHGYVATGLANDPTTTPFSRVTHAAIWYSTDGRTWRVVYAEPPQAAPPVLRKGDPPPPPTVQAASIGRVTATPRGYVATGSRGVPGVDGSVAAVCYSPDGVTWTRAGDAQFISSAPGRPPASVMSDIDDVIEHDGRFLGVGDLYTHSRAPGGGQPCVWTSTDGLHWQHRIVDLGRGFDPYFTSLAVRRGRVVAVGRVGKYPAIAWTSRDLTRWRRTTIAPQAGARLADIPQGLFAIGSLRRSASIRDQRSQPAIWRSTDGRHWRRVLTLPTGNLVSFGAIAGDGSGLLAVGSTYGTQPARPFVYASSDGRRWRRVPLPRDVFPPRTALGSLAVIEGHFVISGQVRDNAAPLSGSTPSFWTASS